MEQSYTTGGIKWIMMTFLDLGKLNQAVSSLRLGTSHGFFATMSLGPGKMLASITRLFIRLAEHVCTASIIWDIHKKKNKIFKYNESY